MKLGRIPVSSAVGRVLVHTLRVREGLVLKKGHTLTAEDARALEAAGESNVVAAELEEGDVGENEAAALIANAAAGSDVRVADAFTGRANLYAESRGVLVADRGRIDGVNSLDEAVTVATLEPYKVVAAGEMVATVKIIPFAAPRGVVGEAVRQAREPAPLVGVAPFLPHRAGAVLTRLPNTPDRLLDSAARGLSERLEAFGSSLGEQLRCDHDETAIAAAIRALVERGCSPILVFGASAIVDRRDVAPRGLEIAGGTVGHLGMPVDPGNLLMLGSIGEIAVVGVPGCARSPKPSGFDWVLTRLLAALPVSSRDVTKMGAGGLLKEIPVRGLPRERVQARQRVDAIVLAAGRSKRMEGVNKLLAPVDGVPLVARVVDAAAASRARRVVVVVGHEAEVVRAALGSRTVTCVENPDFAEGLSTSLRAGLSVLGDDAEAAVVCLGDMPRVRAADIDALIDAFDPVEGRSICVPTHEGRRGNPVLWAAQYFPELASVTGDVGGRELMTKYAEEVVRVPVDAGGVTLDVDTPQDLRKLEGGDHWR